MPDEIDKFLNGLDEVKDDPFKPESEDPFKQEEEKQEVKEVEDQKEEKPLPFHKDPKIQRFIQKEVEKITAGMKPTEVQKFIKDTGADSDEVTDVLTRIIGNDTPEKQAAVKDFKKILFEREEKAAEKAFQKFQEQQQKELEAERQAQEELTRGFESIEESFGVDITSNAPAARKIRGEFVEFIKKISPKNSDGEVIQFPDLQETFSLFQEVKKPVSPQANRSKEIASRGMTRSSDATKTPVTGNITWNTVEKLFGRN